MPRSCPICDHEDLDEINAALASNERIRTIAERWSVRKTALMRHRNEHLPYSAIEAKEAEAKEAETKEAETKEAETKEAEEDALGDDLLDQVRDLQERALATLEEAEEAEELNAALRAIREVKSDLELMTDPLNELDERSVDNNGSR
jgi:vacuolar-type H+-ATPase subunit I/STV1